MIYSVVKRLFDTIAAAAALLVLSPVLLLSAVLIRFRMGKPVLFRQLRPGYKERPFTMYKFRTMNDKRGPDGELLHDHERLDTVGEFLRKSSIDELPELWNVLKGDMSLVGPRPLLMLYLPQYNDFERRRHDAKPGITGWAQVNGRNALTWEKKIEYDVWYVENRSTYLDFKILLMTLLQVVRREGISGSNQTTMPYFRHLDKASKIKEADI